MHKKRASWKQILLTAFVVIAAVGGWFGYRQYIYNEELARVTAAAMAVEEARLAAAERLHAVTVKGRRPAEAYERPAPVPPDPRPTIVGYQDENPDTIGYIKIDGTKVDYPVVQGTDNEYYLNYTFDHIRATRGTIFLDYNVDYDPLDLPPHMLFHGHHMRDGSMFQNVSLYKGKAYFDEHPYIKFETLYQDTVWQVFSVYICDANEYVPMSFKTEEQYLTYLAKTAERSMFPVEMEFTAEDRIMTLNTCSYEFSGAHTLVVAKLVEVYED